VEGAQCAARPQQHQPYALSSVIDNTLAVKGTNTAVNCRMRGPTNPVKNPDWLFRQYPARLFSAILKFGGVDAVSANLVSCWGRRDESAS